MSNPKKKIPTTGYKGFDKNLRCREQQYEVGQEYEWPEIKICQKGAHFCESPLDVFGYYPPVDSRYAEVESTGEEERHDEDSKVCTSRLRISNEIRLSGLITAGVKFILDRVNWECKKESNTGDQSAATNTGYQSAATNTGDRSAATNTGDRSAATNTGYQSAATNTGDRSAATNTGTQSAATNTGTQSAATNTGYQSAATNTGSRSAATNTGTRSAAEVTGNESIAICIGIEGKARGSLGCWLVLADWKVVRNDWCINEVKSVRVDGTEIKADVWYRLNGGKFLELEVE